MNKNTPIFYIMSKNLVVASLNTKFTNIQQLFLEYKVHHLPVMEGDKLLGMISSSDVMKAYAEVVPKMKHIDEESLNKTLKVEDMMTPNPETVGSGDPIRKAAKIFAEGKFQSLPVVDKGVVKGLVTTTDLIDYLLRLYGNPDKE